MKNAEIERKYRRFGKEQIDQIPQIAGLPADQRLTLKALAEVFPFRVNNYVLDELIDWGNVPRDPMFQLTFPQEAMLDPDDLDLLRGLVKRGEPARGELHKEVRRIQYGMNPHPGGQASLNVPKEDGEPVPGMQHKYRETVLFFPSAGQTCHAYCTYCFRWPQFVGLDDMKFASREASHLVDYLKQHREVQSVLITGGDPLVMRTAILRRYIEPLLNDPDLDHVTSIRIGSKAPAYWPHRFIQGPDGDDLLRLFGEVRKAGKEMALMAHFSIPRELETDVAQEAMRRVVDAGATVRTQSPLIRRVNDSSKSWADLWALQVKKGLVPYYMFVERDTGARGYFEVPLWRAYMIFSEAYQQLTGLGRTVRGPVMSCTPGKVLVEGVAEVAGEKVFVLKMLQGRDPSWVNRVFFARYSQRASWMNQLKPAFGDGEFFFAEGMRDLRQSGEGRVWLQSEVDSLEASWRLDSPNRSD